MLVTVPRASPSQDVTRASSVPSRQEGTLGAQSQHVQHGDRVDTHIAIVVDYAARWPRGPGGSWGAWGSLWGARRFVKVLQSGQSPPRRGPRTAPEGQPAPERGRHVPFALRDWGPRGDPRAVCPACRASSRGAQCSPASPARPRGRPSRPSARSCRDVPADEQRNERRPPSPCQPPVSHPVLRSQLGHPGITSGTPAPPHPSGTRQGSGLSGGRTCKRGGGRGGGDGRGHKQTGSRSYGSARKADLSLHPWPSRGTLERTEDEDEGAQCGGTPSAWGHSHASPGTRGGGGW